MQPLLYSETYDDHTYYVVPLAWLATDLRARRVDVCELLLYHTYDGDLIYAEDKPEGWPHRNDPQAHLPSLIGRTAYSEEKTTIIEEGLLQKFDRKTLGYGKTLKAQKELSAGLKYVWADWPPPQPWLYRPRVYLELRWPAWLGRADLSSRIALIALLALAPPPAAAPASDRAESFSLQQLRLFVAEAFGKLEQGPNPPVNLRKGLAELRCLGIVEGGEAFETWRFDPTTLTQPPTWPSEPLGEALRLDPAHQQPLLDLMRELLNVCYEPVSSLGALKKAIQQEYRNLIFSEVEVELLRDHLRSQRRSGRPLKRREVMEDFKRKTARQGAPIDGPSFSFTARSAVIIDSDQDGALLTMPVDSAYQLNATQIRVNCEFPEETPLEEIGATLAALEISLWQQTDERTGLTVRIPLPDLSQKRMRYGFILRANHLHKVFDYSRPFRVLVHCPYPNPRLKLSCTLRVLRDVPAAKPRPESAHAT